MQHQQRWCRHLTFLFYNDMTDENDAAVDPDLEVPAQKIPQQRSYNPDESALTLRASMQMTD